MWEGADLAVRPYPYHSRLRRVLARCTDGVGDFLLGDKRSRPAELPQPSDVRRILVVRPDHLGDVVFATGALESLRALYPHALLTALVGPWAAPLLLHNPYVDEVVEFASPWFDRGGSSGFQNVVDVLGWLRRQRFDVGLDLRGDPRIIALLALGRVRYRIGYGWGGAGCLLSRELEHRPGVHQVERSLAVVRALGWRQEGDSPPTPTLRVSDAERHMVDEALSQEGSADAPGGPGIRPEDKVAVVHPGAGFPSKRWGPERFGALVRWLAQVRRYKVVLIGSEGEKALVAEVLREAGPMGAIDLAGRFSIRQLMALLSRADLMVGNDSGPAHVAAALGTKTVALFSGTNEVAEWSPVGLRTRVVRKGVPCSPCGLKVCTEFAHECMEGLTLEEVQEAVAACESS